MTPTLWDIIWMMAVGLGAVAPAIVLHELVHYVAVWPIAEDVRIKFGDYLPREVEYDLFDQPWRMKWADFADVAPLLLALAGIPLAVYLGPPGFLEAPWLYTGWVVFGLGGGLGDVMQAIA